MRIYYLYLQLDKEPKDNYLSNKQLILSGSLMEIDDLTKAYVDAQDLGDDLNFTNYPIKFTDAIIVSRANIRNMLDNKEKYPKKEEKVLFLEDREFIEQAKKNTYCENIIEEYKNFLQNHRQEIANSLIKYVKLGIDINGCIIDKQLDQLFYAYYKNTNYKKIRDTYIELKEKKNKYTRTRKKEW